MFREMTLIYLRKCSQQYSGYPNLGLPDISVYGLVPVPVVLDRGGWRPHVRVKAVVILRQVNHVVLQRMVKLI